MRPLLRPPIAAPERVGRPATGLLMNAFGPYCSLSERSVPDASYAWDVARNAEVAEVGEGGAEGEWPDLLLLDPATRAAVGASGGAPPSALRLPDRDLTFSLPGEPLFRYTLEEVTVVYLDDDGQSEVERAIEELAIVRAEDARARLTIQVFALNTPYFDAERVELRIPRSHYLAMVDHRVHDRTRAWRRAERMADLAADAEAEVRGPLLDEVRHVAAATGFWSVWATVLWNRFEDPELLHRVLFEPPGQVDRLLAERREAELPAEVHRLGPGPHHAFPGTRADAIGGPAGE